LSDGVEVDETYLGASESGVHGRQLVGKALVVIAVELAYLILHIRIRPKSTM